MAHDDNANGLLLVRQAHRHPSGPAQEFVRVGDEGHAIRFRFCPTCGSTVYYTFDDLPDAIAVTVGAFADPTFPPPRVSVYGGRRHPWVNEPENIERPDPHTTRMTRSNSGK